MFDTLQNWMIFPGAATQGRRKLTPQPGDATELVELKTPTGERITALFGTALDPDGLVRSDAHARPTCLYFYGNAMCLADCDEIFAHLRRLGCNVMIPEFLGYGMSQGKAGEAAVYATAKAAYDHLAQRGDINAEKVIVAGWSLGAAAAVHLASSEAVAGLMIFSAFTSMKELVRRLFPYTPPAMILKHHFENERKISAVRCPVLIVHGVHDSIIPFEMSRRLAAAAPGARHLSIAAADHNDLFALGGPEIWPAVQWFVEELAAK